MIWKDYLTLSEIVSYSKLAQASKAPSSRPNRVKVTIFSCVELNQCVSEPLLFGVKSCT